MIHPIPEGVDPSSHKCGCGGTLLMPYVAELSGHALKCMTAPEHETYKPKHTGIRKLFKADGSQVEVYVATGQEVIGGAIEILDQATALARVEKALDIGMFPTEKTITPLQKEALAIVTLAYGLDPVMGELIPYQGKPFVTIKGRRRKDAEAQHHGEISFRILTAEETDYYKSVGALADGDVAGFCVIKDVDTGASVEGFGRLLKSETTGPGSNFLPQGMRRIEMSQKRQEVRAREMIWGPIAKPKGLETEVLMEGDETNVVEGTARVIGDDDPDPMPDLGKCPEHNITWKVERFHGRIKASHHVQGREFCQLYDSYRDRFRAAWTSLNNEEPTEGIVNEWLKERFDGKTWSKMDSVEHTNALTMITTLPDTPPEAPETDVETQEASGPPIEPPEIPNPSETQQGAVETVTGDQVEKLLALAYPDVSTMDLLTHIGDVTGDTEPMNIPADKYGEIVDWVNQEIDLKMSATTEH